MPYRRLPNTDAARVRAMRSALAKGKDLPPHKLAYSSKIIVRLQKFLPNFEQAITLQRSAIQSQSRKTGDYTEMVRKARLYLTHFLKVMNMAVTRGELPAETRTFFGLTVSESSIPAMNTENELMSWGRRIIEGEEYRIRKGGSPITNPTIAVVKVWYEKFLEANAHYRTLAKKSLDYSGKTNDMRKEADEIILDIWNEVESNFSNLPEEERMKNCVSYGVVYFYRKNELARIRNIELSLQ
jgi:hypothetical protein